MPPPDAPAPDAASQPASTDRARDALERLVLRVDTWILDHWPESPRRRIVAIVAIVAIVVGTLAALRPLGVLVHDLDPLAYVGLAVACWIGAGGALVPIPGVREVSWVMVIHQGAALEPLIVLPVAAAAMALGQTSYYTAARVGAHHEHETVRPAEEDAGESTGTSRADRSLRARLRALRGRLGAYLPAWIGRVMDDAKGAIKRMMHVHPRRAIFLVSIFPTRSRRSLRRPPVRSAWGSATSSSRRSPASSS